MPKHRDAGKASHTVDQFWFDALALAPGNVSENHKEDRERSSGYCMGDA